jgi:hypothetical protein
MSCIFTENMDEKYLTFKMYYGFLTPKQVCNVVGTKILTYNIMPFFSFTV